MYKYEEPSLFSGRRGLPSLPSLFSTWSSSMAFIRLSRQLIQKIFRRWRLRRSISRKDIDKRPTSAEAGRNQTLCSAPEFVDIQAPQQETNAITQVTQPMPPAGCAGAPPRPGTPIRQDPKHPLKIGEDYYPDASKRANEEGRCIVQMTVATDGRIINEAIQTSSGFPRLDEAVWKGVHGSACSRRLKTASRSKRRFQFRLLEAHEQIALNHFLNSIP